MVTKTRYIKDGVIYTADEIKSVTIDGRTYNNPTQEMILAAGYEIYVPTPEEQLAEAKLYMCDLVDAYRQSYSANHCVFDGDEMWFSEQQQQLILTQINNLSMFGKTEITLTYDTLVKPTNIVTAKRLMMELSQYCVEVSDSYYEHCDEVNALTTLEEVENYQFNEGWPAIINLTTEEIEVMEEETPMGSVNNETTQAAIDDLEGRVTILEGNEPYDTETPKFYWEGELPTTKAEGAKQGILKYVSEKTKMQWYATLKVQGDSSASFPKKNFTITFYKDDTYTDKKKVAFKNWGEHTSFVMKAHWIDHSHIRNITAAKIWGQMMESREDFDTLPEELRTATGHGATQGYSFRFWANGQYYGLYEMIIVKKEIFGQSKSNPLHSLLNSDWNNKKVCTFDTLTPNLPDGWTEELQDEIPATTTESFGNLIKLIAGNDDDEILANLDTYLDVDSAIDYDIFARIFALRDNLAKNQIFATYDGTKWYEGAWDMDATAGCPPTLNTAFCDYDIVFQEEYEAYRAFQLLNKLYSKIEELYLARFKNRYFSLRSSILNVSNIIDTYEQYNDRVAQWLDEDYASTTGDGTFTSIPFKTQNNIQQIRSFISKRLLYMDDVINAMSRKVATPTVSLGFTKAKLNTLTAGASIYYTLDGTEPTTASTLYTEQFEYTDGVTVKAISVKNGYEDSDVLTQVLENPYLIVSAVKQSGRTNFMSDYIPNANTKTEYKIAFNEGSMDFAWGGHFISGMDSNINANVFYAPVWRTRGKTDGTVEIFARYGSNEYTKTLTSYSLDTPYTVICDGSSISINGESIITGITANGYPTTPVAILGLARDGAIADYNNNNNAKDCTVYYIKIMEGDTIVRKYIPVYDRINDKYGLMETVTETFYVGSGNGFENATEIDGEIYCQSSVGTNIKIDGTEYTSSNPMQVEENNIKINWIKSITNE